MQFELRFSLSLHCSQLISPRGERHPSIQLTRCGRSSRTVSTFAFRRMLIDRFRGFVGCELGFRAPPSQGTGLELVGDRGLENFKKANLVLDISVCLLWMTSNPLAHLSMPRCLIATWAVRFSSDLVDPFAAWTARPLRSEERYFV